MAMPTLRENQFTHSSDLTTFYWSGGPPSGPLVILIHGWPGNGETWKPQLLALASLGFHVVAPDMRGYGRSSVPSQADAYAVEFHVSDMMALLDHLGRDKAIWIGHDWGAEIVSALASHHPDRCIGMCCMTVPHAVLIDPDNLVALSNREIYPEDQYPFAQWDYMIFHNEQPEVSAAQLESDVAGNIKRFFLHGRPENYGKPSMGSVLRQNGGWIVGEFTTPDVPLDLTLFRDDKPAFERLVGELEKNGFAGPNSYYRNFEANKAYRNKAPSLGRLDFPVLFVGARWDSTCDTSLSRLCHPMRELCKDLTEVTIESGHWVGLERPQQTNAAIVRWIATKLPECFPGYWETPFVSRVRG